MTLREQTLGLVLAHGRAEPTVQRHLPVWRENANPIVFFTPVDDVLDLPACPQYSIGRSNAYSAHTNERTRAALRFASYSNLPYVLLIEYDSLIFGPIPLHLYPDSAWGITCPQFKTAPDEKFRGSQFLHFPILMTVEACRRLVRAMDELPLESEGGLTDRYVGYAAEVAGIRINSVLDTPLVYTRNIIHESMIPEAVEACRKGARWHHGIKSLAVFTQMQRAARGA